MISARMVQIPLPRSDPKNTKKTKKTEKIRKWPTTDNFRIFSVFFLTFGARLWVGGFVYFFRNFFVFWGFRGFWALCH